MSTHFFKYLLCSVVCYSPFVFANTAITAEASTQAQTPIVDQSEVKTTHHRSKTIEALKNIHTEQLKVDAKANQPEAIKILYNHSTEKFIALIQSWTNQLFVLLLFSIKKRSQSKLVVDLPIFETTCAEHRH